MLVVSDTTPLNYLILIRAEHVLPAIYTSILVPRQVIDELLHEDAPDQVRLWASKPPAWVEVREGDASLFPKLGYGEAAALALAIEVHAEALLADDGEARSVARALGLRLIGTVGILAEAHKVGLIDFDEGVKALRTTSIHVHPDITAAVRKVLNLPPVF